MPDEPVLLWPRVNDDPADNPTITFYRCGESFCGATVLICPGGAYSHLADHEGEAVARWLTDHGFHAAVLQYRLGPRHRHPAMTRDAQRAIRRLRADADGWGVNPQAIAVMGFSAGGHLASTLAVHHNDFHDAHDDLAGRISARPDATVLCYPVIDMAGAFTHAASRNHLLGPEPSADLLDLMSTHRHVSSETPPTFLWHTADDAGVPFQNSLCFAEACHQARVPVELHVYETGGHGQGLGSPERGQNPWLEPCLAFLRRHLENRT